MVELIRDGKWKAWDVIWPGWASLKLFLFIVFYVTVL